MQPAHYTTLAPPSWACLGQVLLSVGSVSVSILPKPLALGSLGRHARAPPARV
jgi:hypothetical protein